MTQHLSGNDWIVSHFLPNEVDPATGWIQKISRGELYGGSFIPAVVPGDVQSDAYDAGLIDDINLGFNARKAEWTYQRDWVYVKHFTPENRPCTRIRLCFEAVDHACDVFLNGKYLGSHEGIWTPFRFDVTKQLRMGEDNVLAVLVRYAPQAECQWGSTSAVRHLKPRFAYGWDWCMRLVPLGIIDDVYLRYEQDTILTDLSTHADVDYRAKRAVLHAKAELEGTLAGNTVRFTLTHPDGTTHDLTVTGSGNELEADFEIPNARLWYPNGMGEHPIYRLSAVLNGDWDSRGVNTGLRHVQWKRTEGAGEAAIPYQPYINGRPVFLKGFNFTPIRQLYGRDLTGAYEKRIRLVRRCNANYLRIWGGGLLEKEVFYSLCDQNGILLMQELFQSSASRNNHPPRDEAYIKMLLSAVEVAVRKKRNHPSLICWCGGNELCLRGDYLDTKGNILKEGMEGREGYACDVQALKWVPLDPEYPTLAAMRERIQQLDPQRMWLHTSGSGPVVQNAWLEHVGGDMHDVHGPWEVMGPTEFYTFYNAMDMMIHHEVGCPAVASVQTLETVAPAQYLWPMDQNNPLVNYRGRMFVGTLDRVESFFGKLSDHRTYALTSRFLQWEQYRYLLEAHRRRGLRCAGAALWHLGEPWPNMVENCVIDGYDQVKPSYYGISAACKPLHIAAKYDSVVHTDRLKAEITLYNATTETFTGSILLQLYALDGKLLKEQYASCAAEADSVVPVAAVFEYQNMPKGLFYLRQTLLDETGNKLDSGYSIHSTYAIPYAPLLAQPECQIAARWEANTLVLKNMGSAVVSALTVECDNADCAFFSDGCLMLLPGEEAEIRVEGQRRETLRLYLSGFGVPYRKLCVI